MSARRHAYDETEQSRVRQSGASDFGPLFSRVADATPETPHQTADQQRERFVARQVERLIPVALELARKAGRSGVTIADVRITAVNRGILTGQEGAPHPGTGKLMKPRELSYLGSVMRSAGLVATEEYRRSVVPGSNGNAHKVWLAKEYAP
jgi:hypothetical protein